MQDRKAGPGIGFFISITTYPKKGVAQFSTPSQNIKSLKSDGQWWIEKYYNGLGYDTAEMCIVPLFINKKIYEKKYNKTTTQGIKYAEEFLKNNTSEETRLIAQGARSQNCFFSKLPTDLLAEIAIFAQDGHADRNSLSKLIKSEQAIVRKTKK